MAKRKKKSGRGEPSSKLEARLEPRILLLDPSSPLPFSFNTHEISLAALTNGIITPPPGPGRDRTGPDKDRFRDRMRPKLDKDKLKDIITNNPVFGDKGKIKIPVDGGKEPRWRPGRDGQGGGGKGRKGGKDPGDLIYIDVEIEEFIEWLFEDMELPFMLRKDKSTTLIKSFRLRGLTTQGPDVRIDWEETAIKRIERAIGMLQADPERFPVLDEDTLRELAKALAALSRLSDCPLAAEVLAASANAVELVRGKGRDALPLPEGAAEAVLTALAVLALKRTGYPQLDDETSERSNRAFAALAADPHKFPCLDPDSENADIPSERDVPYQDMDFVYKRVEERYDPDSKAVVFLVLDRSGSMGGEPLAIAKFYFLLNIIFLRTKYKQVDVIMVAHDAAAYEIKDERSFYQIEVAGGTMFAPAYELVYEIASQRYPVSTWNRYMFHATDGYMFDGESTVTAWWDRLIRNAPDCGAFNFAGYLEIDPWAGRSWTSLSWAPGGQALRALPQEIKKHVGMARVSTMDGVLDAFKAILTGDKNQD